MTNAGIYWKTPATSLVSFTTGVFLAIAHHVFYACLAGQPAPTGSYHFAGADVTKQQTNTAIGNALAFLVRFALVTTVATSFVQLFWRAAITSSEGITLRELDSIHGSLENVSQLRHLRVWRRFPMLFCLVLISWCIPIASVVTPATLNVESVPFLSSPELMDVPTFDFASLNFAAGLIGVVFPGWYRAYYFNGTSASLERIASGVLSQGQISPIVPPAANSSWTTSFWGPSLECSDVNQADKEAIWANVWNYYPTVCPLSTYAYLAWMPTNNSILPFSFGDRQAELSSASLTSDSQAQAAFYMATMPDMALNTLFDAGASDTNGMNSTCDIFVSDGARFPVTTVRDISDPLPGNISYTPGTFLSSGTLLRCDLKNTSYTASFKYTGGQQNISVTTRSQNSTAIVAHSLVFGPAPGDPSSTCMSLRLHGGNCGVDPAVARLLSYQGIAAAFINLLTRYISMSTVGTDRGTSVMKTILADTVDLAFLVPSFISGDPSLQATLMSLSNPYGLVKTMPTGSRGREVSQP